MRAPLAKALKKEFERRLRAELPQFYLLSNLGLPPECRVYEWRFDEKLRFYLMLQLHRSEDAFTVEVGWTRNGRWPVHVPMPDAAHRDTPTGDMRFRVGLLWSQRADYWWEFAPRGDLAGSGSTDGGSGSPLSHIQDVVPVEESLARVKPLVADALAKITQAVLPYFDEVARLQSAGATRP